MLTLTNKEIARALELIALQFDDVPDNHGREREVVFTAGTFKVRCLPTRQSVLAVAAKFKKTTKSKFNSSGYKAMSRRNPADRNITKKERELLASGGLS